MACNCVETTQDNVLKHLREKHPERDYEDVSLFGDYGFQNVGLSFTQGTMVYFEFKARYTFTKTNGETSATKTDKVSIYPTFCPFCGKKVYEEKEAGLC